MMTRIQDRLWRLCAIAATGRDTEGERWLRVFHLLIPHLIEAGLKLPNDLSAAWKYLSELSHDNFRCLHVAVAAMHEWRQDVVARDRAAQDVAIMVAPTREVRRGGAENSSSDEYAAEPAYAAVMQQSMVSPESTRAWGYVEPLKRLLEPDNDRGRAKAIRSASAIHAIAQLKLGPRRDRSNGIEHELLAVSSVVSRSTPSPVLLTDAAVVDFARIASAHPLRWISDAHGDPLVARVFCYSLHGTLPMVPPQQMKTLNIEVSAGRGKSFLVQVRQSDVTMKMRFETTLATGHGFAVLRENVRGEDAQLSIADISKALTSMIMGEMSTVAPS